MASLIFGVGIPGSGKTTILRKFAAEHGFEYISPDDIRKEFFGREDDHADDKAVWNEARKRVANFLEAGHTVLFDSRFSNQERRRRFISDARESGVDTVEGLFFDVTLEEILKRNSSREKQVSEEYLRGAYAELHAQVPSVEDGFDTLFSIDKDGNLTELKAPKESILSRLFEVQ
jgi:predicted kinase